MKKSVLIALMFTLAAVFARGQSLSPTVLSNAGGYFDNGAVSLSWTLGELAVTTISSGNYVLTQGFQQVFDFGTSIDNPEEITWSFMIYPNPVQDRLRLSFSLQEITDVIVEIMDVSGRKMLTRNLYGLIGKTESVIDIEHLSQGMYMLHIISADRRTRKTVQFHKY